MKEGDVITIEDKVYRVVKGEDSWECHDCAFWKHDCTLTSLIPECIHSQKLIFKKLYDYIKIKNMNELKIEIPEDHIIDQENSDLVNGIIKFKKKDITLNDVCTFNRSLIIPLGKETTRLYAIACLMDIANYYNQNYIPEWVPDWTNKKESKYFISYSADSEQYFVTKCNLYNKGNIVFNNEINAIDVINNPNFRDILDMIYK